MKEENSYKIKITNFSIWYGKVKALQDISMDIPDRSVTSLIGPSGCGKSTLVRCINRMNDFIDSFKARGCIKIDDEDIYRKDMDEIGLINLRRKAGMIFQKPNPFPFSIYDNIVYGCKRAGVKDKKLLDEMAITSLEKAGLLDEVEDRLDTNAEDLSGGQQQRLCIARAISMQPEIILMDEPCSALDPIATKKIEDLIEGLKKDYTVVIVTHNMQQALRVSDMTAFLYLGKLIEYDKTERLFDEPEEELTKRYLLGKFG